MKKCWFHSSKRCAMMLYMCICICVSAKADDGITEIDGVEYSYWINGSDANGNKEVFLGTQYGSCAVRIPDERKKLIIPKIINGNKINKIYEKACWRLAEVEEIVLPEGIIAIGREAFKECWSLKKINIPSSVCVIGYGAFEGCSALESICLPENVQVEDAVFRNCSLLGKIESLSGIRTVVPPYEVLGSDMFSGCASLRKITISSNVREIRSHAFEGCSKLMVVNLPSSLQEIHYAAFRDCKSLESIDLPDNIVKIDGMAFNGCSNLKTIHLPYRITEIFGGGKHDGGMFGNCKSLTAIAIPENVKIIDSFTFLNCSSLRKIEFSPDIEQIVIRPGAFYGCTSLKEIILPRHIANSVLDTTIDNVYDSKKIRELPGLKITYIK